MFKRLIIIMSFLLASISNSLSVEKNIGISISAGVFETSAKEREGDETSTSKDAEGLFGLGSVFFEIEPNDKFALGIDYVPHSLESETTEHKQDDSTTVEATTTVTNKVQVDFEDLITLYAKLNLNNNFYLKAGYMQVEAVTNETLGTGSIYGDKTLSGMTVGLGYNLDLDTGTFVRFEGNWMQFGGETFTSTNNSDNKVDVDDIDGYGARISVGKSF